jgi:hypothetical protein
LPEGFLQQQLTANLHKENNYRDVITKIQADFGPPPRDFKPRHRLEEIFARIEAQGHEIGLILDGESTAFDGNWCFIIPGLDGKLWQKPW